MTSPVCYGCVYGMLQTRTATDAELAIAMQCNAIRYDTTQHSSTLSYQMSITMQLGDKQISCLYAAVVQLSFFYLTSFLLLIIFVYFIIFLPGTHLGGA